MERLNVIFELPFLSYRIWEDESGNLMAQGWSDSGCADVSVAEAIYWIHEFMLRQNGG
jgi:hypothetical protein